MRSRAGAAVHHVRVPFRAPLVTATGKWSMRESWLLRVTDAEGHAGWGEAVLEDAADVPVLEELLGALVASGLAPSPALVARAGGGGRAFQAALDAARLDIGARRIGTRRVSLPWVGVNATIGAGETDAVVEQAQAAVEAGFRTLKLKTRRSDTTSTLLERLAAVRATVGDGPALRLDVNGAWKLETAVKRLRALAGMGLQYVEQPLAPGDLARAADLRARLGVPVAADEAITSVAAARAILDAGAADILVVKPARVGGPAAVAEIARLAADRGVPVVVSSLFETGVGLAAALTCAASLPDVPGWPARDRDHGLATADLLEDDLLAVPFVVRGGRLHAPGGRGSGGLGVVVDLAALERYRVSDA